MKPYAIQRTALIAFLLTALAITGCRDDEDLPNEPKINEIWFDKATEELKIRFTDGDGDFGLEPTQLDPPFHRLNEDSTENYFYYNLYIDIFYKEDGAWLPVITNPEAFGNNFRIPDLTPEGQSKQLRVLLTVDFSGDSIFTPEMDSVRYEAVLIDRALNISKPGVTDPVIFNN